MAAQVEVKLKGMSDAGVHCSPCRNIPTLPNLSREKHNTIIIKTYENKYVSIKREHFLKINRELTLSDLSAQKRRVWWRFCTTI